ncbi:Calcineurin B-like protein 1 [Nymphaea thermarum]|nr:Calcineurin B-like protein 1 [Nymphaea thermarum]
MRTNHLTLIVFTRSALLNIRRPPGSWTADGHSQRRSLVSVKWKPYFELFKSIISSIVDDGLISKEELHLALFMNGKKENPFVNRIFDLFDVKREGLVNFGDFVRTLSVLHPNAPEQDKIDYGHFKRADHIQIRALNDGGPARPGPVPRPVSLLRWLLVSISLSLFGLCSLSLPVSLCLCSLSLSLSLFAPSPFSLSTSVVVLANPTSVEDITTGLFLPLFFTVTELRADMLKISSSEQWPLLVILCISATVKAAATWLVAVAYELTSHDGILIALLMKPSALRRKASETRENLPKRRLSETKGNPPKRRV